MSMCDCNQGRLPCTCKPDVAPTELAALREELELNKSLLTRTPEAFADLIFNVLKLTKERDAAEQRNVELIDAMETMFENSNDGDVVEICRVHLAALNPTESGASE